MVPKVFVVGSANTDFIVQVPQLPSKGETVLGGVFHIARGGKGANQAVAAARLGGDVTLVARLGQDSFGAEAIVGYRKEGIKTDFIARDPVTPSGVALILVGSTGENMIAVAPGANEQLSPQDVLKAERAIKEASCLLVQLEIPIETVIAAIELASRHNVRVILNPAPARDVPPDILKRVDILTPNEKEAAVLLGEPSRQDSDSLLSDLARKTGVKEIVITLGEKGAKIYSHGEESHVPAFNVVPVDTTACGDAFNGALAVALARGQSLVQAVLYGNAAGATAATRVGAQPSLPTAEEVDHLMVSL
ncbi:MAG: ribokinase [Chloroflexota bacterium]|nr:MAG: ribokinase [Chloroflexota bacterium]